MINFIIKKILIKNFKAIDQLQLDWDEGKLIVLDGPNGYGKTTIFDALELVLTGKIERIRKPDNARFKFNDILFSNDQSEDILIKVQFQLEEEKTVTIAKFFSAKKRLTGLDKQPGKWEIFDTYILESFDAPIMSGKKVNQKDINQLFGIDELERVYSLFYYIQQEENTSFLKRPGKDRMSEISHLFDTKEEEDKKRYFQDILKHINAEKRDISKEISNIKERLDSYGHVEGIQKQEIEYEPLLFGITENILWDRENVTVNDRKTRDKFIEELILLEDFICHFNEFKKATFNQQLSKYANNKILLQSVIGSALFLEKYEDIKKQYEKEKKYRGYLTKLQDFPTNIYNINFDDLYNEIEFNIIAVKEKISSIKSQSKNISMLSKIVNELNRTRDKLLEQSEAFHTHIQTIQKDCPFCGYNWGDHEKLIAEFQIKKEYFATLYDESTSLQEQEIEDLFNEHIVGIIQQIQEYVNNPKNNVNEIFFNQLESGHRHEKEIVTFLKWCNQNNIDISTHLSNQLNIPVNHIESAAEKLSNVLFQFMHDIKEGYAEHDDKFKIFQTFYKDIFKGLESNVVKIKLETIERKKRYIDYLFYHQNQLKKEDDEKKYEEYNRILGKLNKTSEKIKDIITIYDNAIKEHWKKIMIDIEIPFYIYSGKILQNYQRGLGLFIKGYEELDRIVFVSDNSSDHDALNYLSSGQLSALVISFTLALNKVYGNKDLNVLLIDDPVQTMDEINMASFIELLRNEFLHKQIIISTHEEDVSRYLQYKFSKYGVKTLSFNMKEETEKMR